MRHFNHSLTERTIASHELYDQNWPFQPERTPKIPKGCWNFFCQKLTMLSGLNADSRSSCSMFFSQVAAISTTGYPIHLSNRERMILSVLHLSLTPSLRKRDSKSINQQLLAWHVTIMISIVVGQIQSWCFKILAATHQLEFLISQICCAVKQILDSREAIQTTQALLSEDVTRHLPCRGMRAR